MGWSEKDFCIKCDKGGKVLVCSDSGCPIAVHENCMGFPAKFDEMGKFYCPFCVYRQAVEESHQAREKALSRKNALSDFLDVEMINGDRHRLETGIPKWRESSQLLGVGQENSTHSWNDENRLNMVDIHSHPVQLMDDAPECSGHVFLCKETGVLFPGNQNEVLYGKSGDISGSSDCNHRFVVVGRRTESGPIVACGSECVSSEEEDTTKQFEMVEIGNKNQLQSQWQHVDFQPRRIVEDYLDDNNSSDPPATEKQGMEHNFSAETKCAGNDADTLDKYEGRIAGQEEVEEKVLESPTISASDPALQVHLREKRVVQTSDSMCTDSKSILTRKRAKQNDESRDQCVEANCSRRSSRNSASVRRANADQSEKIHDSSKWRKLIESAPEIPIILFPNARRKNLAWTDAEEEMLKEGVQNFSATMNKNIPWRKILEFGRHVFDGSRTPVDLKDKWRNMLAKPGTWLRIKLVGKVLPTAKSQSTHKPEKTTSFSKCVSPRRSKISQLHGNSRNSYPSSHSQGRSSRR